jgi:alpha-tubulin suppressor-like RCC1 family protein
MRRVGIVIGASVFAVACLDRSDVGSFNARLPDAGAPDSPVAESEGGIPTADVARVTTALTSAVSSSCGLDDKGGVHCWGSNLAGALGTGTTDTGFYASPLPVKGLSQGVAAVAGGDQSFCAVLASGGVRCWGDLPAGSSAEPVLVDLGTSVARVSLGDKFGCALDTLGRARCWGAGSAGQLGNGSTDDRPLPKERVATSEALLDVSASSFSAFACGVGTSGRVFCWGDPTGGQLGHAGKDAAVPAPVAGLVEPAQSVATGSRFACALLRDGGVSCWGVDDAGQLGSGSAGTAAAPRRVPSVANATALALGEQHACALLKTGSVMCWGAGHGGAIPGQTKIAGPTEVLPASFGATSIAAGYQSTCARTAGGRVRCFGSAGISWPMDGSFTL